MNEGASDHRTAPVDAEAAHGTAAATVDLPDRWRLLELLGSGGQATVWLAEDRTLGQRVALKILPADADERTHARWLEEVRQGRRLSHPNLIRIFDVVETSDRPVAVMEYVSGGTLADQVVAAGAQPVEDVIRWTGEVLEVLDYLHGDRIVHRDVKPSNLLLTEGGAIKLSDLGLVRSLDRGSDLTRTLEGVGTPRFMSPEQLRGDEPTPSCDLYSLGITMYQLLTGRLPFDGDSAFQIADGHLHNRPVGVREHRPECPRWLARFVERLLEKDPVARFPSAEKALAALEKRQVGLSRRSLIGVAVVAVVAVAAVFGIGYARTWTEPTLDRMEIEGFGVVARDAGGRRLWSQERPGFHPRTMLADFVGGSAKEAVVAWSPQDGWGAGESAVAFDLYSVRGERLRTVETAGLGLHMFRGVVDDWYLRDMRVGDLLGGGPTVVFGVVHPRSYPGMIGAIDFRSVSDRPLLAMSNSGHVQNLTTADLDGDGREEIVAMVLNNPMGFQRVLVTLGTRSSITGETCTNTYSPDINAFRQARSDVPEGCLSYTPLGWNSLVVDAPMVTERGIELVIGGELRIFDRWGNPEESPFFGLDGRAREAFWRDFAETCARLRLAPVVDPPFTMARLGADHPEIMAEAPTEVAATLVAAQALASGGHAENAIGLLRDGIDRFPDARDLQLRLGEQLLIGGQRAEGRDWIAASLNVAGSGRNHNDQAFRLILDAAVNGDAAAYDETRRFLGSLTVSSDNETIRFLDVAWLFFQGEFSDSRLVEVDPGSTHLWVQVLQAWARFEVDHMSAPALASISELSVFHDIQDLTALFEARVRLADGDAAAASQLAEGSLRQLETQCQIESEACAWVPLAEWVLGEALRSIDGREVEAEAVLASAAEHAPNTWIATSITR